MFVGYEVKSNANSAKPLVLETDIKLSQAVLDPAGKGNKKEPVCLMVEYNKKQFILAVLDPTQSWQCPLDLMFAIGSEIKFFLRGTGTVHVTGFEYRDDSDDFEMSMSSDDENVSEDDDKVVVVPKANAKGKAKAKAVAPKVNNIKVNSKKALGGASLGHGSGDVIPTDDSDDEEDEDFNEDFDDSDEDEEDSDASGAEDEEMDTLGRLDAEDSEVDSDEEESD